MNKTIYLLFFVVLQAIFVFCQTTEETPFVVENKYYSVIPDDRVCKVGGICGGYFIKELNYKLKSTVTKSHYNYIKSINQINSNGSGGNNSNIISSNKYLKTAFENIVFYGAVFNANDVQISKMEVHSIYRLLPIGDSNQSTFNLTSRKFYKFNKPTNYQNITTTTDYSLIYMELNSNDTHKIKSSSKFENNYHKVPFIQKSYVDFNLLNGNSIFIKKDIKNSTDLIIEYIFVNLSSDYKYTTSTTTSTSAYDKSVVNSNCKYQPVTCSNGYTSVPATAKECSKYYCKPSYLL